MGQIKRIVGPTALLTNLTTNVYNQGSALIYDRIKRVKVTNKTDTDTTFSLWLGASATNAAGTELWSKQKVPARQSFVEYMDMKMVSTEFIVGGADTTAAALTIEIESEQVVV